MNRFDQARQIGLSDEEGEGWGGFDLCFPCGHGTELKRGNIPLWHVGVKRFPLTSPGKWSHPSLGVEVFFAFFFKDGQGKPSLASPLSSDWAE